MSDDSNTPKEKLDTKEKRSRSLPRNDIGNKIADVYDSWSDPDTLLTLKHQLMNINETCRKVAPSDRDSLVYTETNKTKQYHQKPACSNLPIPKQKKSTFTGILS